MNKRLLGFVILAMMIIFLAQPCRALDPLNLFKPRDLEWTEEMSKKACGQKKAMVKQSHFLPHDTAYGFDCPGLCLRAGQTTRSIWVFQFDATLLKLDTEKAGQTVNGYSGRLELEHIHDNGTLYCHANGHLFAQHSVTVSQIKLPTYFDQAAPQFKAPISTEISKLKVRIKQIVSRDKVPNVRIIRNGTSSVAVIKSVVECRLSIEAGLTSQVYHQMLSNFQDFSCYDHLLENILDYENLTKSRRNHESYMFYEYRTRSVPKPNNPKEPEVKVVGSKIVVGRVGSRVNMPCNASGHQKFHYLWRRRWENATMMIAAKHVARRTEGRIYVDWLDGLVIESLYVDDIKYQYDCLAFNQTSQQEVVVGTKSIELMPFTYTQESLVSFENVSIYISIALMAYVALDVITKHHLSFI